MASESSTPLRCELPRPTAVRHVVVAVTTLAAVLLYLDRFCISFAEGYIKEDLLLSDRQMAWVLSAFFWTYALGQVPSGWLSDRFGARLMLTSYVLLWSLFTGLTGAALGFAVLLAVRFGFGLAQAGAYPTSAGLLSKWVPFSNRGTASSMVAFGGRVGGAVAPILTALLIVAFVPTGVSSLLKPEDLLSAPELCYELCPHEHRARNDTELEDSASTPSQRLSQRILARLPEATRTVLCRVAEEYAVTSEQAGSRSATGTAGQPAVVALTGKQVELIVAGLNEILNDRGVFAPEAVGELPLAREAKLLALRPPSELTAAELQRFGRLCLEAAYPNAIRKIYVAGWRKVMLVYGAIGLAVAGLFWICFRDRPEGHPLCNRSEVELIEKSRPAGAPGPHGKVGSVPIEPLLRSRSMWLICLMAWGTNVGWVFLVTWLPRYLREVHELPVMERGWMAAVPLFVGWFGMLSGGRLTDWLVRKLGLKWSRRLPIAVSRFVAMGAYLVCLLPLSPLAVTAAFALVAFATDIGGPAVWSFLQDVGGRHVGSVLGWENMWGNLGAAISPLLLNAVVEHFGWNGAFLTCAAAFLVAGIAALGVDATVPIASERE